MSVFLGGASGFFGTLAMNDDRHCRVDFQWAGGREALQQPWLDGCLWAASSFLGCDGGASFSALRGNDSQTTGKWENPLDSLFSLGGGQMKKLTGTTLDSTGAVLGNCIVEAFTTSDNVAQGRVTSDTAGYFECPTARTDAHYLVCYKAGSPDVAGTSVNTLTPV